ncbi:hypothetical protein ACQWTT_001178 [Acinetobacter baumannii]
MISLLIKILSLFSIFLGIYLGFMVTYRFYEYIKLMARKPFKRIEKRLEAMVGINEILLQRYNLAAAQLHESYPIFEDKYSINDLDKIANFFFDMDELGIQFIYLKPQNDSQIFYMANCLGERRAIESHIFLEEYEP